MATGENSKFVLKTANRVPKPSSAAASGAVRALTALTILQLQQIVPHRLTAIPNVLLLPTTLSPRQFLSGQYA